MKLTKKNEIIRENKCSCGYICRFKEIHQLKQVEFEDITATNNLIPGAIIHSKNYELIQGDEYFTLIENTNLVFCPKCKAVYYND